MSLNVMRRTWSLWLRGQREAPPPLTPLQQERHQRRNLWMGTLALTLALWAILAVRPPVVPGLRAGYPSPVNLKSPRTISFVSKARTDQARDRAERLVDTAVYRVDGVIPVEQRRRLVDLEQAISQIRDDQTLTQTAKRTRLITIPNSTLVISPELAIRIEQMNSDQWNSIRQRALTLYDRSIEKYSYELDDQAIAELRQRSLPYWAEQTTQNDDHDIVMLFSSTFIAPNRVLDEDATNRRKQAARDAVAPVQVQMLEDESIVRQGDVVTPDIEEKLQAIGIVQTSLDWTHIAGRGIFAVLIGVIYGGYLYLAQKPIWHSNRSLIVVLSVFALMVLAARLALPLLTDWPYAFPLAMAGILLAALFNRSVAIIAVTLLAVLVALLSDGRFEASTGLLLGSLVSIFVIGRPERALTFLFAGVAVACVTALTQVALTLPLSDELVLEPYGPILVYSVLNGALSALVGLGLYNIVGTLAGIPTPFQLMELAHPTQPLLRKLIREAPGTYSHSIAVGNLAESAAEAIGADALLLRIAAYYHDIGKTVRPYFFTDNQSDRENVHNDLDPNTSAQIIVDHVLEGTRLANEAGLPRQVVDFIMTHHGTSIIQHFYQLALQQEDSVDIAKFSYPGPRPQTREQGILMLSDTVEATVRSKAQYGKLISARSYVNGSNNGDKQTLEEMVTSIINERVRSGQLDESQLTLQDLARIRQAFINTLQGIYHPRVEYAPQIVKT